MSSDYTFYAKIKTKKGGTIFSKTKPNSDWVENGKTLFVQGGRLKYDIGWVGVVSGKTKINDGRWHDVAVSFNGKTGMVKLYVDGKVDGEKKLKPTDEVKNHVVRIGFTAPDFPNKSFYQGQISEGMFFKSLLSSDEIQAIGIRKK